MRGLISSLIEVSKQVLFLSSHLLFVGSIYCVFPCWFINSGLLQRVDSEKSRHNIVVTSDVREQILAINQKFRELEKKQTEAEKLQKQNEVCIFFAE